MSRFGDLVFINTSSHPELGKEVAKRLDAEPLDFENGKFENKELRVRRRGDVSGKDVCIFSSLHARGDHLHELRLICNSIQNATRIFGVFPFVRDGKSDHAKRFGEAIAYEETAYSISTSGVEMIAIFDQHSSQHPMAYDKKSHALKYVHHIYLMRLLIEYAQKNLNFDCVIALDDGGFKRNKKIATIMGCDDVAFILKARDAKTLEVSVEESVIVGDVKGKDVISFEDMMQSAGTIKMGALIAKHNGAKSFKVLAVHNDIFDKTFDNLNPLLESGVIDEVVVIETLPMLRKDEWHENMKVISPAKFLRKVIEHIHYEKHMRHLFMEIN
jgi:ribose-phosphate pyrophosphokinase